MILGYALITVSPENIDGYKEMFYRLREDVRLKDPGTVRYDLHQRQDDPCKFIVIEEYVDQAGLDQHMEMQGARPWLHEFVKDRMEVCEFYFCDPLHYEGKKIS